MTDVARVYPCNVKPLAPSEVVSYKPKQPLKEAAMITTIPFSGFYNTIHSYTVDQALEQSISDSSGCHPISDRISEELCWHYPTPMAQYTRQYVADFVAKLNEETGLNIALEWESVTSPREYNFETDRIFATITEADVRALLAAVERADLDRAAKDEFTSYSGFISHYANRVSEWGDVAEWDHNQIGTLLKAAVSQFFGDDWEMDIVSEYNSNGEVDAWLWEEMDTDGRALLELAWELRRREEEGESEIPPCLSGLRSELERVEGEIEALESEGIDGVELLALQIRADELTVALTVMEKQRLAEYV